MVKLKNNEGDNRSIFFFQITYLPVTKTGFFPYSGIKV